MNKLTRVFDNIGFYCSLKDNTFVVNHAIKGFNILDISHIGYYIPYIIKNKNQYEIGVGQVVGTPTSIVVERHNTVYSSNNNQSVNFSSSDNEFYIFANQNSFDTGFNNILIKNSTFHIEPVQATYLVDTSEDTVEAILPNDNKSDNLIIEVKLIGGNNAVIIRDNSGHIIDSLSSAKTYGRFAYSEKGWYNLITNDQSLSTMSIDDTFKIQSDSMGDAYSFQYADGANGFNGSSLYWSSGNSKKLLLGSQSETTAHSIIPTSGTDPVIFNNDRTNSDFIVYGSGNKNLFFAYDGRLGLNIPSGSRPQTIFHVINTVCQEGFRLENRSPCHPANITLYHKPSGDITVGDIVGELNLSGKNTDSNKVDYSQLISKALNTTPATQKGQFEVVVASVNTGVSTLITNPDYTTIGYSTNNLNIINNSSSKLGYSGSYVSVNNSSVSIKSPVIQLQSANVTFGVSNTGIVTVPSLYATLIQSNNIKIPNIAANSVLAIDASGFISAGSNLVKFPSIPSGKILTTTDGGSITGIYSINSYFLTDNDVLWNKYPERTASICLRQILFSTPVVRVHEFEVGDQVAVVSGPTTEYRKIESITATNNIISSILVDQNLTESTVTDVKVHSITRGGYLSMKKYVESGTEADSTSNILSIRPNVGTEFNTLQKDIDFTVYGIDTIPALSIIANNGRVRNPSGIYYFYSTQEIRAPFSIPVTSGGDGAGNRNNTANFQNTASGVFDPMVTTVGTNGVSSYYHTYDQNGNVAEWVGDENAGEASISTTRYCAGGSWATEIPTNLHSIVPNEYASGYNDVGFRVCASYGLADVDYITSSTGLNLEFTEVNDPNNPTDDHGLLVFDNDVFVPTGITNLGVVYKNYRIGTYEITNSQYSNFLNAVAIADDFALYNPMQDSSIMGGITRSGDYGSYSYSTKENMDNKPIVFVDYLSAIRFINWLHNGAPTGAEVLGNSITEDGAYTISAAGENTYFIIKNHYPKYWMPSLNEWHKAAYYEPVNASVSSGTSSVMIKRNEPYLVATGVFADSTPYSEYANLSVSGYLYTDHLIVGDASLNLSMDGKRLGLVNDTLVIESGSYKITIGPPDNLIINTGDPEWDGTYGNTIANNGIVLSANGDISLVASGHARIYSPYPVKISGLSVNTLNVQKIVKLNANGETEALYPGTSSSLLYRIDDATATGLSQFIVANDILTMPDGDDNSPLYVKESTKEIGTFANITYGTGLVEFSSSVKVTEIQVGEDLPFFLGSILTHQGAGPAKWEPAEYLKAEGVTWNRYSKRPVLVYDNKIVFQGGDSEALSKEFAYSDTIAILNRETREIQYVKAADDTLYIVDGPSGMIIPTGVIRAGDNGLEMTFCPQSTWATGCSAVSGYAYSVTKGGYLSMQLDQDNDAELMGYITCNPASTGYLKPNTLNTISTRPDKHTGFNLLAENIDFVVYGARTTEYHQYVPNMFNVDNYGLPIGLIPALKVDANIPNAVLGNAISGVYYSGYLDIEKTQPTGQTVDESAKIYINATGAYNLGSITNGTGTLATYADLTVSKYTYSSGLITNDIFLKPLPTLENTSKYVINAPLTVNQYGQIISQVPASAPTIPGSPRSVAGTPGNTCIVLEWIAPLNNGGRLVSNYLIEYSLNSGNTWTSYSRPASFDVSSVVTGLTNNVEYIFRVSAINSVGTGSPSMVSDGVTPTSDKPSTPRSLVVDSRTTIEASISWLAPLDNGSSTVEFYYIELSDDNGLTWSVAYNDLPSVFLHYTISGLNEALRYLFRVKAKNSSGYGAYAQIDSIGTDPYTPPIDSQDTTSIWDFGKVTFTGVCV